MSDSDASSDTSAQLDLKITNKHLSTFSHQTVCDFNRDIFKITYDEVLDIPVTTGQADQRWEIQVGSTREGVAEFSLRPLLERKGGTYVKNASLWLCVSRLDGEDEDEQPSKIDDALWKTNFLPDGVCYSLSITANAVRSKRAFSPDAPGLPTRYRVVFEYRGEVSNEVSTHGVEARLASSDPGMYLKPPSSFVCLTFSGGRELWIDSSRLCSLSDYFTTCLSSDFTEGKLRVARTSSAETGDTGPVKKKRKTTEDFEDSDEESDVKPPGQPPASSSNRTTFPFQEIPISQTSFVTYRALLVWHQTGFIRFAPLTSSFLDRLGWWISDRDEVKDLENAIKLRKEVIADYVKEDPSLPLPVSPKSIYRLADFLSIPRLKVLALEAYSSRLTPRGAIHELFSKESSCYPEIRQTVFDYIVNNAQSVISSRGYERWSKQDTEGGRGGTEDSALLRQLFEAVAKRGSRIVKVSGPEIDYKKETVAGYLFP
ncbi:hypothetical protein JCM3765_002128 [Sporobolomyces pararoseus]